MISDFTFGIRVQVKSEQAFTCVRNTQSPPVFKAGCSPLSGDHHGGEQSIEAHTISRAMRFPSADGLPTALLSKLPADDALRARRLPGWSSRRLEESLPLRGSL